MLDTSTREGQVLESQSTLGELIRARRIELSLTQEELAVRVDANMRQADISRLERGKVGLPRRKRLDQLADALDLPVGRLLMLSGWAGAEALEAVKIDDEELPHRIEAVVGDRRTQADFVPTYPADIRSDRLREAIERSREMTARAEQIRELSDRLRQEFLDGPPVIRREQ